MIVLNFKENPPEFSAANYDGNMITRTKGPYQIFAERKKSKGTILLHIRCSCGDSQCKNSISLYYNGLNHYAGSRNIGNDKQVDIHPSHKEEGKASNIVWDPTEENIARFVEFSETAREAIAFKQELLKGLFAELQIRIIGYEEIEIIVRKEDSGIRFILFKIPHAFPIVPLLYKAKGYDECLGVIATLPPDTDTSKIKNEYADTGNLFFEPIVTWVKLLGEQNKLNLEIRNVWVMPE